MRLYRFFNAQWGLDAIESGMLRVGRLAELNDPFEWRMATEGFDGEENMDPALLAELLERQEEKFLRMIGDNNGVLCFSGNARESVLWSHYADHHRGLALEMAVTDDPDKLIKINYSNDRICMDYRRWIKEEFAYRAPLLRQMMTTKSSGWSYEDEYRTYESLEECEKVSNGNYFTTIPKGSLCRVIIGWRSEIEESYVRRILRNSGFLDCKVSKAKSQNRSYHITYDEDDLAASPDLVKFGD
ncbi:MAG: DUF2971 domain-containing protein [Luteolibacter sp.]